MLRLLLAIAVGVGGIFLAEACGDQPLSAIIGPAGGELCLEDRSVCLVIDSASLEAEHTFRIVKATNLPPAALSDGYEINSSNDGGVTFLKPARVQFVVTSVMSSAVPSPHLLRVYTLRDGDWAAIDQPHYDPVREWVIGETLRLGRFVVLRADRLPDGGLPIEVDSGIRDGGSTIIIPKVDAGAPDAGKPDSGVKVDAGMGVVDAGTKVDAGVVDSGTPDAGHVIDAGFDAGVDGGT